MEVAKCMIRDLVMMVKSGNDTENIKRSENFFQI